MNDRYIFLIAVYAGTAIRRISENKFATARLFRRWLICENEFIECDFCSVIHGILQQVSGSRLRLRFLFPTTSAGILSITALS